MKKKFIGILLLLVLAIVALFVHFEKNSLTTKTVIYNGNNLRISVDGKTVSTLPSGSFYLVRYDCESKDTVLTWDRETGKLDVSNQNKKGGVSCYLDFQSNPKLADMEAGSYVAYTGNNGCSGESCNGQNANYESELKMGYCKSSSYQFFVNGWRIAYKKNGSAYLISAGATDCMCTSSDGTASSSDCSDSLSSDLKIHFDNMDDVAENYCNIEYSKGGLCDESTVWAMGVKDYEMILGKTVSFCSGKSGNKSCGYANDLIDNGGYYWYARSGGGNSIKLWHRGFAYITSNMLYGVRPVLYLDSSVVVVGGNGTYDDPYKIANNTFTVNGGVSYIGDSNKSAVTLSLIGSDVSTMCINVDSSGCSNYVDFSNSYTLDWSAEEDGKKIIYVYYKNSSGEIIASMSKEVTLDTEAPTNNSIRIGDGTGLTRTLTLFSAGASEMCLSNTSSTVSDCTNWVPYVQKYNWRLSDGTGTKTVYVFFRDKAGNVSNKSATVEVTSIQESNITEDFTDATYATGLTVTGIGSYPWTVSNGQFQSKSSSTSSSKIQFTPTLLSILSFDYGVSSEAGFDTFTVVLTGSDDSSITILDAISGEVSGSITNVSLKSGVTYTLTLSYTKDGSGDWGNDLAYIDNLVIQS